MSESESESGNGSQSADAGPGTREVAHRLFAAEFETADFSYSESDEERAPNYVVVPTGARVNRLFAVGVLTEVAQAGENILRARVVDPSGAFVAYAGQYQPEAMAFFERREPPAFVALTGKARTFQPEDTERVYTSVRPESVNAVDADSRDRWVLNAAERTLERIGVVAWALDTGLEGEQLRAALREAGVDASLASGVPLALEHYGTSWAYLAALQDLALDAIRQVAGDVEEVAGLDIAPDAAGGEAFTPVRPLEPESEPGETGTAPAEPAGNETETGAPGPVTGEEPESESPGSAVGSEPATESTADDPGAGVESEPAATETETSAPADETAGSEADEAGTTGAGSGDDALDDLGDFESGDIDDDPDEFDDVLDEETREEVEAEFGTEFETGSEVAPAGEADIEPEAGSAAGDAGAETEAGTGTPADVEAEGTEPSAGGEDAGSATEPTGGEPSSEAGAETTAGARADDGSGEEAADLEAVLIAEMDALDDGEGAPRAELVTRVQDRTGVSEADVDGAIEEALMSGQCYEPTDDRLKPI